MRQQDLVFCVAIQTCRASRRRTEGCPATRYPYRPALLPCSEVPPLRPRLCACSVQNPVCAKLSLFPSLNSSLKQSQSKLPHRKGASALFLLHSRFGRKSPDTPWVFSWYAETRRHRCKHTCGLQACPFLFAAWRWSLLPFALFMCAVGLVAGLLLGRLACKGDEDMSPWPGNGAGLRVLLAS